MNVIKFVIEGNQEKDDGNPIPYVRSTSRGQFKPVVRRYNLWKQYVSKCLSDRYPELYKSASIKDQMTGKVLCTSRKNPMKMDIMIHWSSDAHGDPDNIWKGIADALFSNDKYLAPHADFMDSPEGKGMVLVEISPYSVDNYVEK